MPVTNGRARWRGRVAARGARSRRSAGVLVAMAFMISPVTSGKLKSSHLFASVTQASRIMFALLAVVCFLRQRCAPGSRFPCGLALGSHVALSIFEYLIGYGRAVDCKIGRASCREGVR